MQPSDAFRLALKKETPLQMIGSLNAYTSIMAEKAGFLALYLSGAGILNNCYGLPDLGLLDLEKALIELQRMTAVTNLPIIVDIDTGFGNSLMLQHTIQELERGRAAGVHIEDQVLEKRCGHRDGKELVSPKEMCLKINVALKARKNDSFFIIARTDALAVEGFQKTLDRAELYAKEGADAIFAEAFTSLDQYRQLKERVKIPILANQTEFGKTPLFSKEELKESGVDIALYPLSLNRIMNKSANDLLQTIRREGSQKEMLELMQTRDELYTFLNYEKYEKMQDDRR